MKPLPIVAGWLVVTMAAVSAQAPDFTGQWRVNHAAGEPPSRSTVEQIWDVTQTPTELTVRVLVNGREASSQTWPLDGRAVPTTRDNIPATTSVTIGKGELVIAGSGTPQPGVTTDIREQWLIDPATKSLRVLKVMSTPASTFTRRLVLDPVARP
jgi:hypothetical protein